MPGSQTLSLLESPVFRRLVQFVTEVQSKPAGSLGAFGDFEVAVRGLALELGREIVASELVRYDVTEPEIVVDGVCYRPIQRNGETYMTACGPVSLERQIYAPRGGHGRAICPLEERIGMVGGFWTPRAAYEAATLVAEVTPGQAEVLLREMTGMTPSKTSLDRLPKTVSAVWESNREPFEELLRQGETVPKEAVTLSVSLDGVLAPMRDGNRAAKRSKGEKLPMGPAGFREVGCAALSFHDADGERISTLRWGRMPEANKETLRRQIEAEVRSIRLVRPDLKVVKLADGARSNWEFLTELEPTGENIVDFFHACEHMKRAFDAAYGEHSIDSRAAFEQYRVVLKESERGVHQLIRSLSYLSRRRPGREAIQRELRYFRNQKHRMHYAEYIRKKLPIASGVVEAACKTLVTQRMKRSGMSWLQAGGQAILTIRGLIQSDRWDGAWGLIAEAFKSTVYVRRQVGHLSVLQKVA
jgi:hypothetical protein